MNDRTLISESYRQMYQQVHGSDEHYGSEGHRWSRLIRSFVAEHRLAEILDYGCGKQTVKASMPELTVHGYDPAFPELAAAPAPADFVFCGDVLEHVEPEFVDSVLDDLQRVTRRYGLFIISTRPATKILPDGRNAHLSLLTAGQWATRLAQRFDLVFMTTYLPELKRRNWKNRIAKRLFGDVRAAIAGSDEVIFVVRAQGGGGQSAP
ncbi:MAG: hypothetical protein ACT4QA_18400 [Panacagrimonas sp.]